MLGQHQDRPCCPHLHIQPPAAVRKAPPPPRASCGDRSTQLSPTGLQCPCCWTWGAHSVNITSRAPPPPLLLGTLCWSPQLFEWETVVATYQGGLLR